MTSSVNHHGGGGGGYFLVPKNIFSTLPHPPEHWWTQASGINAGMRWIMFDWLLDVASPMAMGLHNTCLPICFSIIDQYVVKKYPRVERDQMQLLGLSALFISAKIYGEYAPCASEFLDYTDNAWTRAELIDMERKILTLVGFDFMHARDACPHATSVVNLQQWRRQLVMDQRRTLSCLMDICALTLDMAAYTTWEIEGAAHALVTTTTTPTTTTDKVMIDTPVLKSLARVLRCECEQRTNNVSMTRKYRQWDTYKKVLQLKDRLVEPPPPPQRQIMTRSKSKGLSAAAAAVTLNDERQSKRERSLDDNHDCYDDVSQDSIKSERLRKKHKAAGTKKEKRRPPAVPHPQQRCKGETRHGKRCKRWVKRGHSFCCKHL